MEVCIISCFGVDLQLLTMYLHCKQYKGSIGLSDEGAIILEVKEVARDGETRSTATLELFY